MSHNLCIINKLTILILWISIFPGVAQEKFPGELTFSGIGLESGEAVAVTISASWNQTRWFSIQPGNQHPYLPTSNYSYLSGQGQGDNFWALHAPDDSDFPAIAWGYYSIHVSVPTRNFNRWFDLDLRDANWVQGGYTQQYCQDTEIVYDTAPPNLYHQRSGGGYYGAIAPESEHKIWEWYGLSQNKADLLVPVTGSTIFVAILN